MRGDPKLYQINEKELRTAITDAGGHWESLKNRTVPELLEALACNSIELTAVYYGGAWNHQDK